MIFGLGTDIIEVERIGRRLLETAGLKERLFTPSEIAYCESKKLKNQHFAARYAAKEAFFKALGTGWRNGLSFTDVEVVNDELGKPSLVLRGLAKETIDRAGVKNILVSLSHLRNIVNAIVILES